MKISQRILILIVLNIVALLGMAGSIYHLGESEQEYYEQSNNLLHIKNLLIEISYMEKLMLSNAPVFGNLDRMRLDLERHNNQIDKKLLKEKENVLNELENMFGQRESLTIAILDIHRLYRNRRDQIAHKKKVILSNTELLLEETPDQSRGIFKTQSIISSHDLNESPPYPNVEMVETIENELEVLSLEIRNSSLLQLLEEYRILYSELWEFLDQFRSLQSSDTVKLYDLDDQIHLALDNVINEINTVIAKREDQETYAIISGSLIIILISIGATGMLGRSISRPIEQLRKYVHSIDLTNSQMKPDRHFIEQIDGKKNLEISQLAESYADLEDALFEKMNELEERSANLSLELKERRSAEKKVKQTERYLNNILQSLNSCIITIDEDLNVTHSNKPAEKLSSSEDENSLFAKFPSLKQFEKPIFTALDQNREWFDRTIELAPLKGRFFNISLTPLMGVKNRGIVIRLDDITELRNIENQLLETQKWETLGVLTSGFAHDFNNVLTGIVTSSSILLHKAESSENKLDDTFLNCLNIIDRSGNRAAAMVQQLLSLSRNNELNFTSINLKQSLEDVRSICKNSFDKSVTFELDLPEESVEIQADNAQIEQIFLNLCINSYHAMTDMRDKKENIGGHLKLSVKPTYIDQYSLFSEKGHNPGDYVAVSISDDGVGISEEMKKKIFDPFFTTKDKSKGTGLGLTMVQHIVNQHRGFLELYSELGRGTVVTVYLPIVKVEVQQKSETEKSRTLIKGSGTILVIDDEEVLRVLSESILKECGYDVLLAVDGFDGVDTYKKNGGKIDLVILDMSMPGISGKETFIELKQINPEVPILLSSGFVKDDRIQDLMNLGLEDFIQKPFDFIELSEKVSRIINS